jgi:hypothetical protein
VCQRGPRTEGPLPPSRRQVEELELALEQGGGGARFSAGTTRLLLFRRAAGGAG